jgi:hypothetical protein
MSEQFYMADPAMESARTEIIEVLKKHDLMGAVMICGKERSGFFHEVSPSWSCATVQDKPDGSVEVRIKAKREDFKSLDEQRDVVSKTIGGFMGLLHVHKFVGQNLSSLLNMISNKFEIKHMASDQRLQQGREAEDGA